MSHATKALALLGVYVTCDQGLSIARGLCHMWPRP